MLNLTPLIPLLTSANVRHGGTIAELVEHGDGLRMLWDANEHASLAIPHADAGSDEKLFAAELLAEAALMFLCAAKLLREEAGK